MLFIMIVLLKSKYICICKKEGSGLSDTNTCYYLNIDDKGDLENDIDCVVTINNNSSFETASVTYKVITRGKDEK